MLHLRVGLLPGLRLLQLLLHHDDQRSLYWIELMAEYDLVDSHVRLAGKKW